MPRPFQQLPFNDVPESPRKVHPYFSAPARDVSFDSVPFGPVNVRVRVCGSGPPLLLVHGFMTSSYSFRYVIGPLGKHYTLYIPDLIGAGESSKPRASYSADALATSIGELMDALGLQNVPVIGNSLGGYLCMKLALARPNLIQRLVNLHSPGVPTARMHALRVLMAVLPSEVIVRLLVRSNPERWVHKNVHYFDDSLKSREELRVYAAPLQTDEGLYAFTAMLREALSVADMAQFAKTLRSLPAFPLPLQLVYARQDLMVPPVVGERLHALIPSADFKWLTNASHFAHVDSPEQFLSVALPFLRIGDDR
ncbi:MAG: alpha/beta hydrolase [Sandaracinaceae bacterium]|nr:alpha/beta hydrolase [Sandaracinaceae bacterium]